MKEELTTKINLIAPVLRGLLAKGNICPIIRFSPESSSKETCIKITLPDDVTQEQVIECLGTAFKKQSQPINFVHIEGVGAFEIIYAAVDPLKRVSGKVAIITGAAQGIGLEIAQDMAKQGAVVVLADVNEAEAQRQARQLQEQYGTNQVISIGINVTDPTSIQKAVNAVVADFGGFDVFIANAGVLKAESVKTQSKKDFDFVTDVNYKGYFLCTQVASKILALQHKANPAYMSDIIQINSKSGLAGSNRNSAYAGSKFGGIGLTQSFALELIEDGIKVNSICPGNFFDGPLWSNPDKGLFVQYLRTGKIPGAKTIEDVKKAYESKVPMGRGCTASDVMAAVYYLIEQKYETGQAIPVTGGQVMLH